MKEVFLWRIGSGALPTKKLLASRMGSHDTHCHLCGAAEKTDIHLSFECPLSRAIWFGCSWSLRVDCLNLSSSEDILKFAFDPLPCNLLQVHNKKDLDMRCTIQVALTLEAIWNLRDLVAHGNADINILTTLKGLELKAQEHVKNLCIEEKVNSREPSCWSLPPLGKIKLNVDAAVYNECTKLAVVA